MMAESVESLICKPFTIWGDEVTPAMIRDAINLIANFPSGFRSGSLCRAIYPDGAVRTHQREEAVNRLMQRWRKLGLVTFAKGRWWLEKGAWDKLQHATTRLSPTQ